jgi:hypothetical protein
MISGREVPDLPRSGKPRSLSSRPLLAPRHPRTAHIVIQPRRSAMTVLDDEALERSSVVADSGKNRDTRTPTTVQSTPASTLGRFQFRLRTLLVVVTASAFISWVARLTGPAWFGTAIFFAGAGLALIGALSRSVGTMVAAFLLSYAGLVFAFTQAFWG